MAALAAALGRNVWRDASAGAAPETLAAIARAQAAGLAGQPLDALARGEASFLCAAEAAVAEAGAA